MRRKWITIILVLLAILACQVVPTPPPLNSTPRRTAKAPGSPSPGTTGYTPAPAATLAESASSSGALPPFPYRPDKPFSSAKKIEWQVPEVLEPVVKLPLDWESVANPQVTAGLTGRQQAFLVENGFVVIRGQENQFLDIRERVSARFGQPYYLTTDAAIYALHLAYNELTLALELEELHPRLTALVEATLAEVISYLPLVQDKPVGADALLAAEYLGVALRLLDPLADLPDEIEAAVQAQVAQIQLGAGASNSVLIPGYRDDFSTYKPTGRYASQPALQNYYRGMTWLSRASFVLQGDSPAFTPSRASLIITLALRRATIGMQSAALEWARLQETLTFLNGPAMENTPAEYASWMDQSFGPSASVLSIGDDALWQYFRVLIQQLPPPELESPFLLLSYSSPNRRGWSFFGQRFSPDRAILQSLVYERVGDATRRRERPSGLDVMAALGSHAAQQALQDAGETAFSNYTQQMSNIRAALQRHTPDDWLNTVSSAWLYAYQSEFALPPEMVPGRYGARWDYKTLNSALAGWALQQYRPSPPTLPAESTLQPEKPASGPAPAYVEPAPELFYRLAFLANALVDGLEQRGLAGAASPDPVGLETAILNLQDLGDRLLRLGDIAVKELGGQPLSESDIFLIQAPLGALEERFQRSQRGGSPPANTPTQMPSMPILITLPGTGERFLQLGLGKLDRIFVAIPRQDRLYIAQGGIFSYYEFPKTSTSPINDQEWRTLLQFDPPAPPAWTEQLILPGGAAVDVLAFRVGDLYRITQPGTGLNLRQFPQRTGRTVYQFRPGDYVMIMDGPIQADGFTWWKFQLKFTDLTPIEGWAAENPEWYERAWGQ